MRGQLAGAIVVVDVRTGRMLGRAVASRASTRTCVSGGAGKRPSATAFAGCTPTR